MMARILAIAAAVLLGVAQWFIWSYAPLEATMGLVQKIFYYHLPMSWWGLISFFLVFVCGIGYLRTRSPRWDVLAQASAELGVLFVTLALVTGSVWARAAWGVWWTWDPRLTTSLIMWFVYMGYLALRSAPMDEERRALAAAVLGVVAFVNVPFVFFSARLWRSIHPAVLASESGGLSDKMWHAVIASLVGFGVLWVAMLLVRRRLVAAERRLDAVDVSDVEDI
jgi:heme exporter protein C